MPRTLGLILATAIAAPTIPACRSREAVRAPATRSAAASDRAAVLATVPEAAPGLAASSQASSGLHAVSAPGIAFVFAERGGGVAFVLEGEGKAEVVHDDRRGKPYDAVGTPAVSPDGRRVAYGALVGREWRLVLDGNEGPAFAAVRDPVFSPDGAHLAYEAMQGERWVLVVDGKIGAGTPNRYLAKAWSADSTRLAFLEATGEQDVGRLVVTDRALTKEVVIGAEVASLVPSADRSRVAAIATAPDLRQQVLTFAFERPEQVTRGKLYENVFRPVFGPAGDVAYLAWRGGTQYAVRGEREERMGEGEEVLELPVVVPGRAAVGGLVAAQGRVRFCEYPAAGGDPQPAYEEAEGLAYSGDGRLHAYAARRGAAWFVVVNGKEGPAFDRVVTPVFSPDGKVVYRARKDGKRFVVVADASGRTIRQHPAYEQVFPVGFTADGRSVAYGVKDGALLAWKVEEL